MVPCTRVFLACCVFGLCTLRVELAGAQEAPTNTVSAAVSTAYDVVYTQVDGEELKLDMTWPKGGRRTLSCGFCDSWGRLARGG